MKYVIAAPPGGLAHFLSRIIADEYNFKVHPTGSYHSLKKTYSSQTAHIDEFNNVIHDTDHEVICLHNFDNRDLSTCFKDRTIINIVIDGDYEIYLNNYYRKAIQSSDTYWNKFINQSQKTFPTSDNYLREEFFFMYRAAVNHEIPWIAKQPAGITIPFSNFYMFETFTNELSKITDLEPTRAEDIWNHFITAQQSILNRVSLYQPICDQVIQKKPAVVPEYFDNIDYGIMCGMIFVQTGIDTLNLNNNNWL
jgi:hypothetical protein